MDAYFNPTDDAKPALKPRLPALPAPDVTAVQAADALIQMQRQAIIAMKISVAAFATTLADERSTPVQRNYAFEALWKMSGLAARALAEAAPRASLTIEFGDNKTFEIKQAAPELQVEMDGQFTIVPPEIQAAAEAALGQVPAHLKGLVAKRYKSDLTSRSQ